MRQMLPPTKFWLYKSIGDSQIVRSYSLPVDHPEQCELGRQCVHDHRQVSLSNLTKNKKQDQNNNPDCGHKTQQLSPNNPNIT